MLRRRTFLAGLAAGGLALGLNGDLMLRRLLMAAGGSGGSFTPPMGEEMLVAYLTRLSNHVVNDGDPFPFDTERITTNATYFTWTGTPGDPLVCVAEGWYNLRGNFTSLGTFYGGSANTDWSAFIGRNGDDLDHYVVASRKHAGSGAGASADLLELSDDVYLFAADEITVSFSNNTGAGNLLIESNPSDGVPSGYLTDAGPGTLSPHLIIETRSGPAPIA